MKRKTFILPIIMMLLGNSTSAQWANIWTNSNISGSSYAVSADTFFVTGWNGYIYRTINGGVSWDSAQSIFTTSWYNHIMFSSNSVGYACGGTAFGLHSSTIAKTTDAGQTWDSLTSNTFGFDFYKIFCLNDSVVFFCGEYFVKTMNGGQTFTSISLPYPGIVTATHFFNDTTGLISTDEYVSPSIRRYRIAGTTDGGLNWTTYFIDSTSTPVSVFNSKRINDIYFRDPLIGYAIGDNGRYLSTANGGLNWTLIQLVTDTTHFNNITLSNNSGVGYMIGWKYASGSFLNRIYKTIDFGFSWQQNFSDSLEGIYNISMATDDTVYATGYNSVFKTVNGGVFINELPKRPLFTIYPNPASKEVMLRLIEPGVSNMKIIIYDLNGKIVTRMNKEFGIGNRVTLDISSFASGVYFLNIANKKEGNWAKFIKE